MTTIKGACRRARLPRIAAWGRGPRVSTRSARRVDARPEHPAVGADPAMAVYAGLLVLWSELLGIPSGTLQVFGWLWLGTSPGTSRPHRATT